MSAQYSSGAGWPSSNGGGVAVKPAVLSPIPTYSSPAGAILSPHHRPMSAQQISVGAVDALRSPVGLQALPPWNGSVRMPAQPPPVNHASHLSQQVQHLLAQQHQLHQQRPQLLNRNTAALLSPQHSMAAAHLMQHPPHLMPTSTTIRPPISALLSPPMTHAAGLPAGLALLTQQQQVQLERDRLETQSRIDVLRAKLNAKEPTMPPLTRTAPSDVTSSTHTHAMEKIVKIVDDSSNALNVDVLAIDSKSPPVVNGGQTESAMHPAVTTKTSGSSIGSSANNSPDTTNQHSPGHRPANEHSPGRLTIATDVVVGEENNNTTVDPGCIVKNDKLASIAMTGSVLRAPGHAPPSSMPPVLTTSSMLPTTGGPPTLVTVSNHLSLDGSPAHPPGGSSTTTTSNGQSIHKCNVCTFESNSKFHFNSHMNTHTDHRCAMCDYTSRTEGRLKRHMKEFHTKEQRAAVGLTNDDDRRSNALTPPSLNANHANALQQMAALTQDSGVANANSLTDIAAGNGVEMKPLLGMDEAVRSTNGTPSTSTPPRRHSNKPKQYKCKQCPLVHTNKEDMWAHAREHIPPEKQLGCPKCGFVTEYKHHLEYHIRNHFGSKPFECEKCTYTCVNKSMLNSHMKSHSDHYQYRCQDCTYATKYCHSLKLHLRKYGHRPSTVINSDGTSIDPTTFEVINHRTGRRGNGRSSHSRTPPSAPPSMIGTPNPLLVSGGGSSSGGSIAGSVGPPPLSNTPSHIGLPLPPSTRPSSIMSTLPPALAQILQNKTPMEAAAFLHQMRMAGLQLPQLGLPPINGGRLPLRSNGSPFSMGFRPTASIALNSAFAPPPMTTRPAMNGGQQQFSCKICRHQCIGTHDLIKHHVAHHPTELAGLHRAMSAGQSVGLQSSSSITEMPPLTSVKTDADHSAEDSSHGESPMINIDSDDVTKPADEGNKRKRKANKLDKALDNIKRFAAASNSSPNSSPSNDDSESPDEARVKIASAGGDTSPSSGGSGINEAPTAEQLAYLAALNQQRRNSASSGDGGESTPDKVRTAAQQARQALAAAKVQPWRFACTHCGMAFQEEMMHRMHMAQHSLDDPFKCSRCGHLGGNAVGMHIHMQQAQHDFSTDIQ